MDGNVPTCLYVAVPGASDLDVIQREVGAALWAKAILGASSRGVMMLAVQADDLARGACDLL